MSSATASLPSLRAAMPLSLSSVADSIVTTVLVSNGLMLDRTSSVIEVMTVNAMIAIPAISSVFLDFSLARFSFGLVG